MCGGHGGECHDGAFDPPGARWPVLHGRIARRSCHACRRRDRGNRAAGVPAASGHGSAGRQRCSDHGRQRHRRTERLAGSDVHASDRGRAADTELAAGRPRALGWPDLVGAGDATGDDESRRCRAVGGRLRGRGSCRARGRRIPHIARRGQLDHRATGGSESRSVSQAPDRRGRFAPRIQRAAVVRRLSGQDPAHLALERRCQLVARRQPVVGCGVERPPLH